MFKKFKTNQGYNVLNDLSVSGEQYFKHNLELCLKQYKPEFKYVSGDYLVLFYRIKNYHIKQYIKNEHK